MCFFKLNKILAYYGSSSNSKQKVFFSFPSGFCQSYFKKEKCANVNRASYGHSNLIFVHKFQIK